MKGRAEKVYPHRQIAGINKWDRDPRLQVSRSQYGVLRAVVKDQSTRWLTPPESTEKSNRKEGQPEFSIDKRNVPAGKRGRVC